MSGTVTPEHRVTYNGVFTGVAFDCGKNAPAGRRITSYCNKCKIAFMGCNSSVRIAQAVLEVGE